MAKRIAINKLNASTIDILNVIRQNASSEYQNLVPEVTQYNDIPKVGEVLMGYPVLANEFLNALINRIALVRAKSATFNNPYVGLKKGYLEYSESVEEVFINITKAREFSAEKAKDREFRRSIPDVRAAFHVMNIKLQYPVTIEDEQLKRAFLSINGVTDMISAIIQSVYTALEYDEFLLFKYLIIKAVSTGKMYPISVDTTDIKNSAVAFRGTSNRLGFVSTKYNASGVHTNTEKADQIIFMSADFNAQYDVNVLASAFNMDKATFSGNLYLIDDFNTFDNERFSVIRAESTGLDEVTAAELALMNDIQAVLVDREWFQFYDNLLRFTDVYVASGLYRNYFLNAWKTISFSPFSNAIAFVNSGASVALPASVQFRVVDKQTSDTNVIYTLEQVETGTHSPTNCVFVQTQDATTKGIAVHRYGAFILPNTEGTSFTPQLTIDGTAYNSGTAFGVGATPALGATVTFTKVS